MSCRVSKFAVGERFDMRRPENLINTEGTFKVFACESDHSPPIHSVILSFDPASASPCLKLSSTPLTRRLASTYIMNSV